MSLTNSTTLQDSIIHIWGTGKNTRIADVTLEGHGVVGAGIMARRGGGPDHPARGRRHFRDGGVIVDENKANAQVSKPPLITDIDAAYVSGPCRDRRTGRPRRVSGSETWRLSVEFGRTTVHGRASGSERPPHHALFEDIRVTGIAIGVYVEHFAFSSTFRRLQIGPGVKIGLVCEWADPGWSSTPACVDNTIEDSSFDTSVIGVYFDEGHDENDRA